ncbi:hypothetical protein HU200_050655 [Digitaria exilis]|uniref:Uncharacterized protein n=1 Tax=Digitaria exilis TaxID=1010633 RepID=A0A835E7F5_9POAL|nr:hypothetical protein HU200_050655 [Digitaria exilis]
MGGRAGQGRGSSTAAGMWGRRAIVCNKMLVLVSALHVEFLLFYVIEL